MNNNKTNIIDQRIKEDYKYGFVTDIESETLPPGISEETIQFISEKKKEPSWLFCIEVLLKIKCVNFFFPSLFFFITKLIDNHFCFYFIIIFTISFS